MDRMTHPHIPGTVSGSYSVPGSYRKREQTKVRSVRVLLDVDVDVDVDCDLLNSPADHR